MTTISKPPKILIIRFSSIGDIVLTTPVIRCLKQQLGAEVHFLCKKSYLAVLANNPYLDRIFTIEKKVSEVLKDLKKEQYHYIIDLHNNLRSAQMKFSLGKKSYIFDKINFQKWLMTKFKINRLPDRHIVDRYMDTVKALGVNNDGEGLDYFVGEGSGERGAGSEGSGAGSEERGAGSGMVQLRNPKSEITSPFIAFAIGAAHQTKRLPKEKIIAICQKIKHPVVLLGGPGEQEEGERIAKASGDHVINSCGALSLNQSAAVVKEAWKVITHDTGMMHIAAAFHKDIISIWGNTIPEFGMYPYLPTDNGSNTTIEVKGLSCRPCSKIGYQACPKKHFKCMMNIDVEEVVKLVNRNLELDLGC